MPPRYQQRAESVEAIQFTDYRSAVEILTWVADESRVQLVTQDKRTGECSKLEFTPQPDGGLTDPATVMPSPVELKNTDWMVLHEDGTLRVWSDWNFRQKYTKVNT